MTENDRENTNIRVIRVSNRVNLTPPDRQRAHPLQSHAIHPVKSDKMTGMMTENDRENTNVRVIRASNRVSLTPHDRHQPPLLQSQAIHPVKSDTMTGK